MHRYPPYRRDPIVGIGDRRSSDRHTSLTIATRPLHLAHPFPLVADLPARPMSLVLYALRRLIAMTGEWRRRARSRRELLMLDERLLKDIGITRINALYEATKPFWR